MSSNAYPIRCIRLINFHNLTNETINLEEEGHLFLLGDNGCGKTTILDAIHYALTAGLFMEWNSAARMSGSKRDGRRVQGIVLRYNLDTGILNKNGAISYAALELVGRHGKPLTIGVGISATAMDEKVGFWGVIRECSHTDLPFLIEEEGRLRPSSRQEFRQGLEGGRGFFTNQTDYRREIGERLFGGPESYKDICRFLAMGKSYREISAGAADYHDLFKRLLPEPGTAIFEQIIDGLRSIDESQTILDDLERKMVWLSSLNDLKSEVAEHRLGILRYNWLLCRFSIDQSQAEQITLLNRISEGEKQLLADQDQLTSMAREEAVLEDRLANLKAKDSSGLVLQEKNCRRELEHKKSSLALEKQRYKELENQLRTERKEYNQLHNDFQKLLTRLLPELASMSTSLPFSIQSLQAEIDDLCRKQDLFNNQEPNSYPCIEKSDQFQQKLTEQQTLLEQQQRDCNQECEQQEIRLANLEKQNEIYPDLPGYQDFLHLAQSKMLVPRPLYMGLEWSTTLKKQERCYIEECIGEDILSTLLFRDSEYSAARHLVPFYPQIRISTTKRTADSLPAWMRQVFDIKTSDPECLRCLASEMESGGLEPQVTLLDQKPLLAFRSHERILCGNPARLIGSEGRKKALATEISKVKEHLRILATANRKLTKEIEETTHQYENLKDFKLFLNDKTGEIRLFLRRGKEQEQKTNSCEFLFHRQQETTEKVQEEVNSQSVRLTELRELIAKEGLANLDRRINKVSVAREKNRRMSDALKDKIGGDKRQAEDMKQKCKILAEGLVELNDKQIVMESILQKILPDIDDLAHYILKTRKGQQFKSHEAIIKEIENCSVAARTEVEKIKMQLNNPEFGGAFRFSYEDKENELYDYRQQTINSLISQQTTALEEQKEVISERTRELFKKIIMTDLMQYLRGHVGELDQMIRRINTLLRDRSFGGQRYSFKIRPLDQFTRLINTIKKFSPFDPAAEKELEDFFSDHRDTIIATEVGTIPEELDYRNWYRYEMEVSTIGEQGKIMDRRNKSIGSGGEQAVPNYLLILTIAHFMYRGKKTRIHTMLFDEAFYGIDAGRRDQILGFATDLGLQLFIASPDQDGVRREVRHSTTLLVKKDTNYDIHLYPFHWRNPVNRQIGLFNQIDNEKPVVFDEEL